MRLVRERPATFSRNPGMPTISERMIPESLKLSVWSKSLASKYSFAIILVVSSLGSHTRRRPHASTPKRGGVRSDAADCRCCYIIPRDRTGGAHTAHSFFSFERARLHRCEWIVYVMGRAYLLGGCASTADR